MNKKYLSLIIIVCLYLTIPARAGMIYTWSGLSATNGSVSLEAKFEISGENGDTLTLTLTNTSTIASASPADILSSFYFDVYNGSTRPELNYISAVGEVFLTNKKFPDDTVGMLSLLPGEDLAYNQGWLYQTFSPNESMPFGFGIGTAGNNGLQDEGFNFPSMDGIESSIYAGDVYTQNLDGYNLIKGSATFVFSGMSGYTIEDIGDNVAFGLGTAPDSLEIVPVPATIILGLLGLGVGGWKLRKML